MPIPTDTYWNIKRLNVVFAASAVVLALVTIWAIVADWKQDWRVPQRDAKVWQAALVQDKIDGDMTPDKAHRIEQLKQEIEAKQASLGPKQKEIDDLKA